VEANGGGPNGGKPMLHLRLDERIVKMIDYLAVDWDISRSGAAERLILEALERYDARKHRDSLLVAVR